MDTNDNIAPEVPVFAHRHYIDVDDQGRIVYGWLQNIRPMQRHWTDEVNRLQQIAH